MQLSKLLSRYIAARHLRPRSVEPLQAAVSVFSRWLARPATTRDFKRDTLNHFVDWLLENRSPDTAWGRRKDLLTLWRFAFDEGIIGRQPLRIKEVKRPTRDPDAWTQEEVRQLLLAADEMPGTLSNGVPVAVFFRALLLVLYSTGLRITAALNLRYLDLRPDGTIPADWRSSKTHYQQTVQLQASAVEACRNLRGHLRRPDERLLPWPYDRTVLYKYWRRLLKHAGMPVSRRNGSQKIRRTAASWLERVSPGSATRFLGHASPELAAKHYLDPRIIYAEATRTPPPL